MRDIMDAASLSDMRRVDGAARPTGWEFGRGCANFRLPTERLRRRTLPRIGD